MQERAPRPLREVQAELRTAAQTLRQGVKKLKLAECMTELERHYPEDIDTERIQDGEICPPLAWGIHVDTSHANIQIEEAIQSLECAARRTQEQVREDWVREKIKDVNDPSARALLGFVMGLK